MDTPLNDTRSVARLPIHPSNFSQPFWNASRDRRLVLQYCERTAQYQFFPRPLSLFTGRRDGIVWRESPGLGRIYTYTIANQGVGPFRGQKPFFVALVELDEGVRVLANIVNCPIGLMRIDMLVRPYWHELPDGTCMLMFQPVDDAAAPESAASGARQGEDA